MIRRFGSAPRRFVNFYAFHHIHCIGRQEKIINPHPLVGGKRAPAVIPVSIAVFLLMQRTESVIKTQILQSRQFLFNLLAEQRDVAKRLGIKDIALCQNNIKIPSQQHRPAQPQQLSGMF